MVFVLLVLMLVGVTMVVGTGDIAVAQHAHERADEAATLGALSGAESPGPASVYAGSPSLDGPDAPAIANCQAAIRVVAPEATIDDQTCRVDATNVARKRLLVTVVIKVTLPIPVPFISPTVRAHRESVVVEGTQSAP